jgi:hypothetical protein
MHYSEKFVALTPDEVEKLRKEHRTGTILSIVVLAVLLGAATFFFVMGEDFLPFRIFAPIFAAMAIGIVATNFYQQRKNIQSGVKIIMSGEIEDKKEIHLPRKNSGNNDSYKFILGGKEIDVSYATYHRFHLKDTIEITKLPYSGTVLDVRLVESNTGISSNQLSNTAVDGSPLHDAKSITPPQFTETSYPLDTPEELYLRRTRNKRVIRSFRWALVPVWIYLFFKFIGADSNFIVFLQSFRLTIPLVIVLLPSIIQAFRIPRLIIPFNQDISSGMKTICRTIVTDKLHGTTNGRSFDTITVNGKQYSVPESFYHRIDIGEEVAMHYAEYSKTEFSIVSTQDRTKFVAFYS